MLVDTKVATYLSIATADHIAIPIAESPMRKLEDISSWEIDPDKKPDLGFDDWHCGFSDATASVFPSNPGNIAYMMGWLQGLGMDAGYANLSPTVDHPSYMDGYNQAIYERNLRL